MESFQKYMQISLFFFPPGDLKVQIIVFNAETDQHIYAHIYLFILSIIFNNYFFISKK